MTKDENGGGLLGRWDQRNQHRVEHENERANELHRELQERRLSTVASDGQRIMVHVVPTGEIWPPLEGDGLGELCLLPVVAARCLMHRNEFSVYVGKDRRRSRLSTRRPKVLFKEHGYDLEEAKKRARQLAAKEWQ